MKWNTTLTPTQGIRIGSDVLTFERVHANLVWWTWCSEVVCCLDTGMMRLGDVLVEVKRVERRPCGVRVAVCVEALQDVELEKVCQS